MKTLKLSCCFQNKQQFLKKISSTTLFIVTTCFMPPYYSALTAQEANKNLSTFQEDAVAQATPIDLEKVRSKCSSIDFTYTVWHEEIYNEQAWQQITQLLKKLTQACQSPNNTETDILWINLLGNSFREALSQQALKKNIAGSLTKDTENETLYSLNLHITPCPNYTCSCASNCSCDPKKESIADDTAWQTVVDLFVDLFITCETSEKSNKLSGCGPAIRQTIALAGKESGIHGEIKVSLSGKNS